MKARFLYGLVLLISCFTACKKEGIEGPAGPQGPPGAGGIGSADPNIYNKWEVVSGLPGTKYVIIKNDNSFYQLDSAAMGFKNLYNDAALITGSQILCWNLYNYTISNDTLRLTNLNATVVLKKNNNAPNETQWVTIITETDSINSPIANNDGREDLGFDGMNILWTANYYSDTLYKINPTTHQVSGRLPLSTYYGYGQVNYGSSSAWISNSDGTGGYIIDKVNPANGNVSLTSPQLATQSLTSIALAGQNMWYCDWNGDISTWDVVSNIITPQFHYRVDGMEYVNGYLYLVEYNSIYKCQPFPFHAVTTYKLNSYNASYSGITYDGSHFWVVKYDYNQQSYKLVKLSI